ncbi:MurR/RpiR family transcriptional regulator [[Eubacterium] hominis]|uniref:MurR/RpiR family transcriptional regulator n=1 Tax=[Eubacterium] hominis TaxID=2764325 RepID=UPI003A4DB9F8
MDMVLHKLMLTINTSQQGSTNCNLAIELIKHIDELQNLNIYEIADLCFVSTSTLSRFCRQLGYKNFNAFKEALETSYGFEIDYDKHYLLAKDHLDDGLSYMKELYLSSIKDMNDHLQKKQLIQLAELIHDHENIYIFGNVGYQFIAMYLQERLGLFKKIIHVSPDINQQKKSIHHVSEDDLAILISPRGSSNVQSRFVPDLYKSHATMVLITQNEHSAYKDRYDLFLNIHGSYDNNLGMISVMYTIDQLILVYYALYHDELIV